MPNVTVSKTVNGDIDKIYAIICNMVDYPKFMPDVKSVELLNKQDNQTTTHWITNVDGRKIEWTEEDVFFPDNYRIEYKQTKGDLKEFSGYWQLANGSDGVEVTLYVDFDFGIPMIAGLLNPLLKRKVRENSENMISGIIGQL